MDYFLNGSSGLHQERALPPQALRSEGAGCSGLLPQRALSPQSLRGERAGCSGVHHEIVFIVNHRASTVRALQRINDGDLF